MTEQHLHFEKPTFFVRLKSMLSVDFYRLFHTPLFYIFVAIAAIIPAMVLGMTGMENPDGTFIRLYDNTWQVIAATKPLYAVSDIAEYANMNMVYIFGGIMLSIFIGHDYASGYVKSLFTTHAKKQDYVLFKTVIGAFSMACMCVSYFVATVLAGALTQTSFAVNVGALLCALLAKLVMCAGWASLYTFVNVVLRRFFGVSIALSFFFGTGILVMGAGALLGNTPLLNVFLYGASVSACLSAGPLTVLTCLAVSCAWAAIYALLATTVLNRTDVY